ncbi:MAG: transglycosylase domain-containing protein [Clostridia bacterium]|nr:transglycosylase domain-containing protein [Clostridia bacterium]
MKKVILGVSKAFFLIFLCFAILFVGTGIYSITFLGVPLSINKITSAGLKIDVFSAQGLELQEFNSFNQTRADFAKIPTHVASAFISIEDKKFYQHNGVNFPRMTKAFINNITSCSLKEGASTITQQLIKNTHLNSQKNLPRKFNEVRLAIQLEKQMDKDEILEHYLNAIYFGNNCWGIESASQYYFSKPVQYLTLSEGALLAGMIKSPNSYSPIKNAKKATVRRNLVLSEMQKDGTITAKESIDAQNAPLGLNINKERKNKLNSYSQSAIDEACEVLNLTQRQLAVGDYKVYTYQNLDKQLKLNALIEKSDIQSDFAVIDINAQNGGIEAFVGASDYKILEHKRQIGSIAKPLFVYGPAVNENILSPASLI